MAQQSVYMNVATKTCNRSAQSCLQYCPVVTHPLDAKNSCGTPKSKNSALLYIIPHKMSGRGFLIREVLNKGDLIYVKLSSSRQK